MRPLFALLLLDAGAVVGPEAEQWPKEPMSMLELALSCDHQPSALNEWFPPHHLKVPMPKAEAGDPNSLERRLAIERCASGEILRSYQEPILAQGSGSETYRVIWSRSFRPPVVIRVEESHGRYTAVVKRDLSRSAALSSDFKTVVSQISESDFRAVRAAAIRAGCWAADHACHAELSFPRDAQGRALIVTDGETWLLEGARAGEHWGVAVHDPRGGPLMEVWAAILKAANADDYIKLPDGKL
jgi:hypothetical protein